MLIRPSTICPAKRTRTGLAGLAIAMRNPLEYWSEPFFREEFQCARYFGRTFLTITDPGLARDVLLTRADLFRKSPLIEAIIRPILGDGLVSAVGADWRRQRRIVAPVFRPAEVLGFLPLFLAAGDLLADRLGEAAQHGTVDIVPQIQRTMLDAILDSLFGASLGEGERRQVRRDVDVLTSSLGRVGLLEVIGAPPWMPRRRTRESAKAANRMRHVVSDMILERRSKDHRRMDLLDLLLHSHDPETGEVLPDRLVAENMLTFLGAGTETTGMALVWTLFVIAHLPGLQMELRDEARRVSGNGRMTSDGVTGLALHDRVVMEALRLYPPVASIGLTPTRSTTIGGQLLRPGDHVAVGVYPINRHRSWWRDADSFDPDRFLRCPSASRSFAYLPFGNGRRICVGKTFAMLLLKVMLARLLERCEFATIPGQMVVPRARITLHPVGGLKLGLRPVHVSQK